MAGRMIGLFAAFLILDVVDSPKELLFACQSGKRLSLVRLDSVRRSFGKAALGYRFFWVGLLFFSALSSAEDLRKRIRVGGGYSVPWAYLGPEGTPTGFYIEVMKEAARREGLAFEPVFRKDGAEKALRSGDIDIWTAAVPTAERRKVLYFTSPWWSQDHYLGVLSSSPVHGVNDLVGRSVVYSATPPFTANLAEVLPGAKLLVMNDLRARFAAVCDANADAVLFHHETSLFAVTGSNEMYECRERGLRLIPVGRPIMDVSLAALPENRELADRFRARLAEMAKDQTLTRLSQYPLTGNESVAKALQAEQSEHSLRLLQLSVAFLGLMLVLGGAAHVRLRRANQRTKEALEIAEKALRVKSEFLATMSHEIRTPMTAVMGYMDMLMGTPLRHDQRRFAAEVTQATSALLTLITSILGYARPGRPAIAADETLDLAGVVDDCLAAVLLDAESKGLALTIDVDPAAPRRLCGEAVRPRQAILNLLVNAVKFTARGWVRLRVIHADGVLICVVSDSGEGIPESKRSLIFEPFTQLDSSDNRRYGGIGLGLALVADIARQLGGSIAVDSDPGGGARFTLRLPLPAAPGASGWLDIGAQGAAAILAAPDDGIEILARYLDRAGMSVVRFATVDALNSWEPPPEGRILCFVQGEVFGDVAPLWRNRRTTLVLMARLGHFRALSDAKKDAYDDILPLPAASRAVLDILQPPVARGAREYALVRRDVLVVDDNPVNRRVLSALLEKLGCRVETAKNGREAVDAAARMRYHAIFMDCQMPVMNGYEATSEIRRQPLGADLPIFGVSASIDMETRLRCEASGMSEFVPKPVTLDTLQDLLTRLAARQIIEENLRQQG